MPSSTKSIPMAAVNTLMPPHQVVQSQDAKRNSVLIPSREAETQSHNHKARQSTGKSTKANGERNTVIGA